MAETEEAQTLDVSGSGSSGSPPSPPPPPPPPPPLSPLSQEKEAIVVPPPPPQPSVPTMMPQHLQTPPGSDAGPKNNDQKLLDLTNKTKYNLVQRNGQRIYGGPPPDWEGLPPEKGCEVFVGKVPRDCYEDELVPIFASVGKIYELRLMMDFSGSNRGYFFVRYTNREDAKRAVRQLNNYEIRPGKNLGVIQSVDNRKLWISGIPKNRTAAEIKIEMERITEGVRDVILYQSQTDKSKTRGYAFVEYESHRAAALARRKLVPGRIFLLGQEIEKVDWAEPENEVDEEIMNKVRVLFIRNLMACTTEEQIRNVFEDLSGNKVERVKKTKDYAFVHLSTREAAEQAMARALGGLKIDGSDIEVNWSKPVDKNLYNTRKQLTKILSFGSGGNGGGIGSPMGVFDSPLSQLNPMPSLPVFHGASGFNRGIAPLKRGAAGIRGLGAPGTAPPRRLVKMSNALLAANNGLDGCNGINGGGGGGGGGESSGSSSTGGDFFGPPTQLGPPAAAAEFGPPPLSPFHPAFAPIPAASFFGPTYDRMLPQGPHAGHSHPHPHHAHPAPGLIGAAASGGGGHHHHPMSPHPMPGGGPMNAALLEQQLASAMFNLALQDPMPNY